MLSSPVESPDSFLFTTRGSFSMVLFTLRFINKIILQPSTNEFLNFPKNNVNFFSIKFSTGGSWRGPTPAEAASMADVLFSLVLSSVQLKIGHRYYSRMSKMNSHKHNLKANKVINCDQTTTKNLFFYSVFSVFS